MVQSYTRHPVCSVSAASHLVGKERNFHRYDNQQSDSLALRLHFSALPYKPLVLPFSLLEVLKAVITAVNRAWLKPSLQTKFWAIIAKPSGTFQSSFANDGPEWHFEPRRSYA